MSLSGEPVSSRLTGSATEASFPAKNLVASSPVMRGALCVAANSNSSRARFNRMPPYHLKPP